MNDPYGRGDGQLVPGTLRGYRAWYIEGLGDGLRSTSHPYVYMPGVQTASCASLSHSSIRPRPVSLLTSFQDLAIKAHGHPRDPKAPQRACHCGFYALYKFHWPSIAAHVSGGGRFPLTHVEQDGTIGPWRTTHVAVGSIKASGRIILGTLGFRAERVEIEALVGGQARTVAEDTYHVPWFPTMAQLLEEFPPSNVDELLRPGGPAPMPRMIF